MTLKGNELWLKKADGTWLIIDYDSIGLSHAIAACVQTSDFTSLFTASFNLHQLTQGIGGWNNPTIEELALILDTLHTTVTTMYTALLTIQAALTIPSDSGGFFYQRNSRKNVKIFHCVFPQNSL